MKVENKSKSKIIKFLNGKAFYVVLCLCLIAVGVAAWSGVEGLKNKNSVQPSDSDIQNSAPSVVIKSDQTSDFIETGKNDTSDRSESDMSDSSESDTSGANGSSQAPDDGVGESTETAAPVAAFFVNPVLGEVIKDFSDSELQYSLTMKDMRLHSGVDIAADVGTPVIAAGDGVVTEVCTDPMLGSVVVIDHGNGITVRYCGLNAVPTVKKGDIVDSSRQIGTVDVIPSESVEQRHLHLEFYKDGKAVSPLDYIVQ